MSIDPYATLGLTPQTATADAVKKAYRRLAMECHPDKNRGDPASEERFKRINEAYGILSDPQKKNQYDVFGGAGNGVSLDDILSKMFGNATAMFPEMQQPTQSVHDLGTDVVDVELTLAEVARGCVKRVEFDLLQACGACNGLGAADEKHIIECPVCRGKGVVVEMLGPFFMQQGTCGACSGTGKSIDEKHRCVECAGKKSTYLPKTFELKIPAGVPDRYEMKLQGQGSFVESAGKCRDMVFRFRYAVDEHMYRVHDNGYDVTCTVPVTLEQLLWGFIINVELLDTALTLASRGYFDPVATVVVLKGAGLPNIMTKARGDLSVKFSVSFPRVLDPPNPRPSFDEKDDPTWVWVVPAAEESSTSQKPE